MNEDLFNKLEELVSDLQKIIRTARDIERLKTDQMIYAKEMARISNTK